MRTPNEKLKKIYMIISLAQVHPRWRIDSKEVSVQITMNDDDDKITKLLEDFYKYQEWPMDKKEFTRQKIAELINQTKKFKFY
jgi:hypothetical protein